MSDCIFCDIIRGQVEASFLHQDPSISVFMDIKPITPGHILVVPNGHASCLMELSATTGAYMFKAAQRLAAAIRSSGLQCEGINFFLADGKAAGQEILHVHLHVFPRFKNDGFRLRFAGYKPTRSDLDTAAEKIRNQTQPCLM